MKVKNVVFSGFAAAIFAGVCGAATAAVQYELTSKSYVDAEVAKKQNILTAGDGIDITGDVIKTDLDLTTFATKTDMQAADQTLQGNIDAEASARASTDKALDDKVTAMDAAYKLADTGLQSQIDAVKELTGTEGVADQISAAVNAEKLAREQADAAMAEDISENVQAIADEAAARAQADTALENAYKAADSTLDGKITAEATARANADTAMAEDIADLVAADTTIRSDFATADKALEDAYKAADTTLDGKITAEASAREQADAKVLEDAKKYTDDEITELNQSLSGTSTNLGALTGRVTTAEGEIDDLQAADTELDGKISANAQAIADEATARANADTALENAINAENFVSANGILTTKGGYLVISDGAGNITLNQVAVVDGDGKTDIITGETLQ